MPSSSRKNLIAFVAGVLCLAATPALCQTITQFDSNASAEKFSTLPGDLSKHVLLSAPLDNALSANDVLQVMSEFELTNDTGVTQRLSAQLILADGGGEFDTTGIALGEQNSKNISPGLHHGVRVKGALKQFASAPGSSKRYVNLVVWATGSLTVEIGNGRLQGMTITP